MPGSVSIYELLRVGVGMRVEGLGDLWSKVKMVGRYVYVNGDTCMLTQTQSKSNKGRNILRRQREKVASFAKKSEVSGECILQKSEL